MTAALAGLAAFAPARALAETVRVRGGEHPNYSRLVFDFARPVAFRIDQRPGSVTIRFARAADFDFSDADRRELSRISGHSAAPSGEGVEVRLAVPPGATVKQLTDGSKVVLDIGDGAPGAASAPAAAAATPAAPAPAPRAEAPAPPVEAAAAEPPPHGPVSLVPPSPPRAQPAPAPAPHEASAPHAVPDAPAAAPAEPVEEVAAVPQGEEAVPVGASEIRLDLPVGAAAVFERAGRLGVAANLPDRSVAEPLLRGAARDELRAGLRAAEADGGDVWTFPLSEGAVPHIRRDGNVLVVRLDREPAGMVKLSGSMEFQRADNPVRQVAVFELPGVGAPISARDPVVGDVLLILPVGQPGVGLAEARSLPDFDILPALQGVVLRPRSTDLSLSTWMGGAKLDRPGGLAVTPESDHDLVEAVAEARDQSLRFYDFAAWQGAGDYDRQRREILSAAADRVSSLPYSRAMDMARLTIANGLPHEALGFTELAALGQPDLVGTPELTALRGAANAMIGRADEAMDDLRRVEFDDYTDIAGFRGLALAEMGDWQKAHDEFRRGLRALIDMPDPLFRRLATKAAESAAATGDTEMLQRLLPQMEARGEDIFVTPEAIIYFKGELAYEEGDVDGALAEWDRLALGSDHFRRAQGGFRAIEVRLGRGDISNREAIDGLERLGMVWRGDALEFAILKRLGELYLAEKRYREGLLTLRGATIYFPGSAEAEQMTREMSDAFRELFVNGAADSLDDLSAVALFNEFRELTPLGPDGDAAVRHLADRMVALDSLSDAAGLLEDQARYRLGGQEKARIGARAAGLRLLNREPDKALSILDATETLPLPPDLARERVLLRAKALADKGEAAAGLALLTGKEGDDVEQARAEIAWKSGLWGPAAAAMAMLIPPPPEEGVLDDADAQMVLNRAIALALAGDRSGLAALRRDYGPALAGTRADQPFMLLTRPASDDPARDLATVRQRAGDIDMYKTFLEGYRASTGPAPPPPETAEPEASPEAPPAGETTSATSG
jgi:hypothetical protein